eukprot:6811-Heterococcus_DN1.PRE.2
MACRRWLSVLLGPAQQTACSKASASSLRPRQAYPVLLCPGQTEIDFLVKRITFSTASTRARFKDANVDYFRKNVETEKVLPRHRAQRATSTRSCSCEAASVLPSAVCAERLLQRQGALQAHQP